MAKTRRESMAVKRRGPWARLLLAVAVFLFCLLGWGGWRGIMAILESDFLTLRYIEVEGCRVLPDSLLHGRLAPLLGRALHSVDPDSLEEALADLPRLKSVRIARRLPGTLRCRVEERSPRALWFDGRFTEIDGEGDFLQRFGNPPPDLPIIRSSALIPADSLRGLALDLLDALTGNGFDLSSELSEITAEKLGIVYYRLQTPTRVILGWRDFHARARYYREAFTQLSEDGFPVELDLRYRDMVITRDSISTE